MNPLTILIGRLADRLHAKDDAAAIAAGFVLTTNPDGTRTARLRGMTAIAAAHRARVAANPDPIDRMFLTPDLIRHINREQRHRAAHTAAPTRKATQ
jgi:hypothetical protein